MRSLALRSLCSGVKGDPKIDDWVSPNAVVLALPNRPVLCGRAVALKPNSSDENREVALLRWDAVPKPNIFGALEGVRDPPKLTGWAPAPDGEGSRNGELTVAWGAAGVPSDIEPEWVVEELLLVGALLDSEELGLDELFFKGSLPNAAESWAPLPSW